MLTTPDGRYVVVRGRLWRASNPDLPIAELRQAVDDLMAARRAVKAAKASTSEALSLARGAVDAAKHRLGERGPPWWADGAPDLNRRMVANSPYADWYRSVSGEEG